MTKGTKNIVMHNPLPDCARSWGTGGVKIE